MNNFKNRVTDNTYLSHLNPAEDSLFHKYDSFTDIKLWTHHSDTTKGYSLLNHTVLPGQPNYVYNTTHVVGGISKAVSIIYDPSELNIQDEPTVILLAKRLDLKQYIYTDYLDTDPNWDKLKYFVRETTESSYSAYIEDLTMSSTDNNITFSYIIVEHFYNAPVRTRTTLFSKSHTFTKSNIINIDTKNIQISQFNMTVLTVLWNSTSDPTVQKRVIDGSFINISIPYTSGNQLINQSTDIDMFTFMPYEYCLGRVDGATAPYKLFEFAPSIDRINIPVAEYFNNKIVANNYFSQCDYGCFITTCTDTITCTGYSHAVFNSESYKVYMTTKTFANILSKNSNIQLGAFANCYNDEVTSASKWTTHNLSYIELGDTKYLGVKILNQVSNHSSPFSTYSYTSRSLTPINSIINDISYKYCSTRSNFPGNIELQNIPNKFHNSKLLDNSGAISYGGSSNYSFDLYTEDNDVNGDRFKLTRPEYTVISINNELYIVSEEFLCNYRDVVGGAEEYHTINGYKFDGSSEIIYKLIGYYSYGKCVSISKTSSLGSTVFILVFFDGIKFDVVQHIANTANHNESHTEVLKSFKAPVVQTSTKKTRAFQISNTIYVPSNGSTSGYDVDPNWISVNGLSKLDIGDYYYAGKIIQRLKAVNPINGLIYFYVVSQKMDTDDIRFEDFVGITSVYEFINLHQDTLFIVTPNYDEGGTNNIIPFLTAYKVFDYDNNQPTSLQYEDVTSTIQVKVDGGQRVFILPDYGKYVIEAPGIFGVEFVSEYNLDTNAFTNLYPYRTYLTGAKAFYYVQRNDFGTTYGLSNTGIIIPGITAADASLLADTKVYKINERKVPLYDLEIVYFGSHILILNNTSIHVLNSNYDYQYSISSTKSIINHLNICDYDSNSLSTLEYMGNKYYFTSTSDSVETTLGIIKSIYTYRGKTKLSENSFDIGVDYTGTVNEFDTMHYNKVNDKVFFGSKHDSI